MLRIAQSMLLVWCLFLLQGRLQAAACPFCPFQGQTLVKEVQQARFVIYGTPSNPQIRREADGREISSTVITIDDVVKSDPFLKNKRTITLPRYIPPLLSGSEKLLLFCDLNNDQPDTYLYLATKEGAMVKYLKEAIKLDEKDIPQRLHFYFNYLDHAEAEIVIDAFREFGQADYSAVAKLVKKFGNDQMRQRLRNWLNDPNTPINHFGLLGMMLGLFGKAEDGKLFLALLTDPEKSLLSGIDGILAGYVLADADAGWKFTKGVLAKSENDFSKRYAALRTVRFLWDNHSQQVPQPELLAAVELLLNQGDLADLAIEDLRKWKQWKYTSKIVGLGKRDQAPIVQRSILRYMLAAPKDVLQAAEYIEAVRQEHPEKIKDAQELLDLEKANVSNDPSKAQ